MSQPCEDGNCPQCIEARAKRALLADIRKDRRKSFLERCEELLVADRQQCPTWCKPRGAK